jgi:Periplasmic copper-binding protein (NosD)
MNPISRFCPALQIFLSLALTPWALAQGPLAPGAPPAPSMKSLDQIDARVATAGERIPVNATTCPGDGSAVYVVAQRGSYFLSGDVVGVSGKNGVHITSPEVTLDLNGYQIDGAAAPGQIGILIDQDSVTVRNGRVLNWSNHGIDVEGSGASQYERVVVANCGTGFFIFGVAQYESCSAINNQGNGFDGFLGHVYRGCYSSGNGGIGFALYNGNTAEACLSVRDSTGFGIFGVGTAARGCTASQFFSSGFFVTAQSASLVDCSATTGVSGGAAYLINDPDGGIPSGAVLNQCSAAYFPGVGGSVGFDASNATGVTITACTATGWSTAGISVGPGGMVSGCNASNNGSSGIVFSSGCAIVGNVVSSNGVGISGSGVQNRLDGNTVTRSSVTGILATDPAATNVIVRNFSRNVGANYDPVVGGNVGPTDQTPAGVTTSPWANF